MSKALKDTIVLVSVLGFTNTWEVEVDKDVLDKILEEKEIKNYIVENRDGKRVITFHFLKEEAKFKTNSNKHAATCAFVASQGFFNQMLGKKLDREDEMWYVNHPHVVSMGLKENYTFGSLNALIRPFDVGIKEILIKRGRHLQNCEEWIKLYGLNPLSAANPEITHEEAIRKMYEGQPEELIQKALARPCRMKVVDSVTGPAIIFATGRSARGNGWAGSFAGGHASYIGPRRRSDGFEYAIRYEPITAENAEFHAKTPIYNYSDEDIQVPDFEDCKFCGKTLREWGIRKSWSSAYDWGGHGYGDYRGPSAGGVNQIKNRASGAWWTDDPKLESVGYHLGFSVEYLEDIPDYETHESEDATGLEYLPKIIDAVEKNELMAAASKSLSSRIDFPMDPEKIDHVWVDGKNVAEEVKASIKEMVDGLLKDEVDPDELACLTLQDFTKAFASIQPPMGEKKAQRMRFVWALRSILAKSDLLHPGMMDEPTEVEKNSNSDKDKVVVTETSQ